MSDLPMLLTGALVRILQGFANATPTLLVGLMIAAIFRYYLGRSGTQRLFGGQSMRALPQSWLVGMLLPVCSIGVLPIAREMRRAGVKAGALSAFALSAPLFNPLSLLYGLTLSRPLVIILFALGSLAVVSLLGVIWDRFTRNEQEVAPDEDGRRPEDLIGLRRVLATVVHFAREASGVGLLLALLAVSGLALVAIVLPYGAMQNSVEQTDSWAPLTMTLVAMPVYATPMMAMSQLGMMFQHANSPGAAFALLILGTGLNLATPIWLAKRFGWRSATIWLSSLVVIVVAIAYSVNKPLIPPGIEPAGHTHAFDIYTHPLTVNHRFTFDSIRDMVTKDVDLSEKFSLGVLAFMATLGLAFRGFGIDEQWILDRSPEHSFAASIATGNKAHRGMNAIVPGVILGATMLLGLVALSVAACYGYYPSTEESLEEIKMARAECLSGATSGAKDHALYWLPIWEEWSRRLEVGTFIRRGELRPYQRMQGYLLRKKLETLEHELEHAPYKPEEVKKATADLLESHSRFMRAYRE